MVDSERGNTQQQPGRSSAVGLLLDDLDRHVHERFSDRIPEPVVRTMVAAVVARWRGALDYHSAVVARGLRADVNRAALAWLRTNPKIDSRGPDYDDLFADTVFGGGFDAAAIRWGIHLLVHERRMMEALIMTQYLDMAELDGMVPTAREVLDKLKGRGRGLSEDDVHNALVDFHCLLHRAP
ncbi:hypothetical protein [Krasilnikovia sp. MM14-A1004]|uniref:hypothetical protein n=1 Tax=Krasilnikovia sp. MM14-A1004 TaxID=3373541 RepID=UPI00399D3CA1